MSLYRFFFFQAEDGIRDLVRSRGLGDVYKRQIISTSVAKLSRSSDRKMLMRSVSLPMRAMRSPVRLSLIHI